MSVWQRERKKCQVMDEGMVPGAGTEATHSYKASNFSVYKTLIT